MNSQLLHQSQWLCWPWSPWIPPITASPWVTSKPSVGTMIVVEKALALMCWQPVQWHSIVIIGGLVMRKRTLPQRQPPSIGGVQSGMAAATLPARSRRRTS
ncbi:MAG: hypothetical protein ABIR08_02865 [Sphingomonas sp.]